MLKKYVLFFAYILLLSCSVFSQPASLEEVKSSNSVGLIRERGKDMLKEIKEIIRKYYYDKNFKGIDLDERFKIAEQRIKTMNTNSEVFRVIAQVVLEFEDSHTRFIPPGRENQIKYGFSMQMIGNECFIISVDKGSDAEAKGVKVGDIVTKIGNYTPTRDNLWKLKYIIYSLHPQEKIKLQTISPDDKQHDLEINASFITLKDREKKDNKKKDAKEEESYKCQKVDSQAIACKLETFSVEKKVIDKMMAEVRPFQKLILDLRGNGGGYVHIEEYLTGHFFDRNIKIADFITRDKVKERIAKPQKEKLFRGDVVVLIDSNSASASEVFARVIQIEKRGKVIGDVSSGAVMTSYFMTMANSRGTWSMQTLSFYALNITIADLIMSDGQRLENVGVIPDHPVGPTGEALSKKSDPVLAFAAQTLGSKLSSEDAGKFNFLFQKSEEEYTNEKNSEADEPK